MLSSGSSSLETLTPIFYNSFYVCLLIINLVLCCSINGLIDYFMNKDKGPYHVVSESNIFNMIVFSFVLSLLTFFGSSGIHKRIKEGKNPTVTRKALCDTCFKKVICFAMQEPAWKKRVWLFMWNCMLFPGLFLVIMVSVLCMFATGFKSLGSTNACEVSEATNVIVIVSWKAAGMFIIFTMNYAAAHNEEQPEISEFAAAINGGGGGAPALVVASHPGEDVDNIYNDQA